MRLAATIPALVPEMTLVLSKLVEHDKQADQPVDFGKLDLEQATPLHNSPLYKMFVQECVAAKIAKAQQDIAAGDADRRQVAMGLLPQAYNEEQRAILQFAVTIFGPSGPPQKVQFLMEGDNLDKLFAWNPEDQRLSLALVKGASAPPKDCAKVALLSAADFIISSDEALDKVDNPLLKKVLGEYKKLVEIADAKEDLKTFAQALFLDICSYKLGMTQHCHVVDELEKKLARGECEVQIELMCKLLAPTARKIIQHNSSASGMAALLTLHDRIAEKERAPAVLAASEIAATEEAAAGREIAGQENLTEEQKQRIAANRAKALAKRPLSSADRSAEGATPLAESEAPTTTCLAPETAANTASMAPTYAIGDVVVTKSKKHQQKYNGCQARVLKILTSKLRVEMIEGGAVGEEKDFLFENVSRAVPQDRPSQQGGGKDADDGKGGGQEKCALVPAAGCEKRKLVDAVDIPGSAKAQKIDEAAKQEALAMSLFGDLSKIA
jgi:hypothetical protein